MAIRTKHDWDPFKIGDRDECGKCGLVRIPRTEDKKYGIRLSKIAYTYERDGNPTWEPSLYDPNGEEYPFCADCMKLPPYRRHCGERGLLRATV